MRRHACIALVMQRLVSNSELRLEVECRTLAFGELAKSKRISRQRLQEEMEASIALCCKEDQRKQSCSMEPACKGSGTADCPGFHLARLLRAREVPCAMSEAVTRSSQALSEASEAMLKPGLDLGLAYVEAYAEYLERERTLLGELLEFLLEAHRLPSEVPSE